MASERKSPDLSVHRRKWRHKECLLSGQIARLWGIVGDPGQGQGRPVDVDGGRADRPIRPDRGGCRRTDPDIVKAAGLRGHRNRLRSVQVLQGGRSMSQLVAVTIAILSALIVGAIMLAESAREIAERDRDDSQ